MITKKLSAWSLAFGLVFAPLPFLFRTDNVIYAVFEQNSVTLLFVVAMCFGALVSMGIILRASQHLTQRFLVVAASLLVAAGLLCVLVLEAFSFIAVAVTPVSGFACGLALVFLLFRFGVLLYGCSPWLTIMHICGALFGVSVIWFALTHLETSMALCLCLGALCLIGSLLFCAGEKRASGKVQVSACEEAQSNEASSALESSSALKAIARSRRALAYFWAGFYGIAFNFFTLGLTFWPQNAGLPANTAALNKPLSYLIIGLSVFVAHKIFASDSQREASIFYHAALPIGAAIVLASPFLDAILPSEAFFVISCVSYIGIALLNVLGLTASLWAQQLAKQPYSGVFFFLVALCVTAFIAGLAVFYFFGQQAQIISLCVLALFLALMVVTAMKNGYNEHSQSEQPQESALSSSAKRVVGEFGLSPREAEILEYLARGRGAKYVGEKLFISSETVRTHAKRIYEKTGVHTKEELLDLLERYQ